MTVWTLDDRGPQGDLQTSTVGKCRLVRRLLGRSRSRSGTQERLARRAGGLQSWTISSPAAEGGALRDLVAAQELAQVKLAAKQLMRARGDAEITRDGDGGVDAAQEIRRWQASSM
jgi:hypothetical protein